MPKPDRSLLKCEYDPAVSPKVRFNMETEASMDFFPLGFEELHFI